MPGSPVHTLEALTATQVYNLVDTYAKQSIKIHEAKFPAIGGLRTDQFDNILVGALVDIRNSNAPDSQNLGGPFSSTRELYIHHMDAALSAIRAGQLFRAAPLRAYLAHLHVKDLILSCPKLREEEKDFYLKHPDGKTDNILIDAEGAVTALLDWEW